MSLLMDPLKMKSHDVINSNVEKIAKLFPACVTEVKDSLTGGGKLSIDFEKLQAELSNELIGEGEERYQFTWPGKREAVRNANTPTTKTLRPCREESVDFDNTRNLYIEGDNLDILKTLRETYLGKVKMIYIDPPYNTGNDFVYNDDFAQDRAEFEQASGAFDEDGNQTRDPMQRNTEANGRFHTDWLNMMFPRLKVARDLLTDDGVIFISIDDNEVENLRKICDEIYGESNFITSIVWQSTAGSNTGTDIVAVTEYILVYVKNRGTIIFDGMLSSEEGYTEVDEHEKERGRYCLDKMDRRRVGTHYSDALNYPLTMPDGSIRYPGGTSVKSHEGWNYLWGKQKVEWGIQNGFVEFKKSNGEWAVYNKRYFKVDNNGHPIERTIPFRNLIFSEMHNTAQGTGEIRELFTGRPFDFPKPSGLIKRLLLMAVRTHRDAIVLDFFSGSATTAHAVMKLNADDKDGGNRKFIMVQWPEKTDEKSEAYKAGYKNICEIGKERIRRAGAKIKAEADLSAQHLDIGFRVLKLDSSNMEDVYYTPAEFNGELALNENVKPDRGNEDLLFQVMLDLGIELSAKIESKSLAGKTVHFVDDNYLVACFDREVNESTITEIAKLKPVYFVMRDASAANDNVIDNFEQIFRHYSPDTNCRIL